MRAVLLLASITLLKAQDATPFQDEIPAFGISVYLTGLTGQIYAIKEDTKKLPDFKKLQPIGTVYTYSLAIPPRDFSEGFPGLPDRVEWFAIDYTGRFWIANPGLYRFILTSDDGSCLYIDDKKIIDNDGVHPPESAANIVNLKPGLHEMRVSYFQGPRQEVALMLDVVGPDGIQRPFNTQDFRPPPDLEDRPQVKK
jgi:hypothetical protein